MLRTLSVTLGLCTLIPLKATLIDTGTQWLYNLPSVRGHHVAEELFFDGQLKDHTNTGTLAQNNYWDENPANGLRGQRVLRVNGSWEAGGPIFVHIGGEAPIHAGIIGPNTTLYQFAQENQAMMVALEHRYYSQKTNPTIDFNATTRSLLTSAQALADAAYYIAALKKDLGSPNSKVIVFGYGYGGNLATWARSKYSHVFDEAVASGAPLLAKYNFQEYFQVVNNVLGSDFVSTLGNAMSTLHDIIIEGNKTQLARNFGLDPAQVNDTDSALAWFYDDVMTPIGLAVMHNKTQVDVITPFNDALDSNNGSAYDSIITLHAHLKTIPQVPTTAGWYWQACHEFGYFQSASGSNQPFAAFSNELTADYLFKRECTARFGFPPPSDNSSYILQTNTYYGGLDVNELTNIVFPQGRLDPWNALGAGTIYNINNATPPGPLYFDACAHGPDFLSTSPDCPSNSNALRAIEHNITQWLGQSVPFDFGSDSMPAPIMSQNTNVFAMHSPSTPPTGAIMSCNKLFEVVVQRVPSNVKAGGTVKLDFHVRTTDPTVTDALLVGVVYPNSERIFFAKGSITPQSKTAPIEPVDLDVDDLEGIYWKDVPSSSSSSILTTNKGRRRRRMSHVFSTKFIVSPFFDPAQDVELFPGACLTHSNGGFYCCQYETVKVNVRG